MGLLDWLSGHKERRRGAVRGDGEFGIHVVGTSHHQDALAALCNGRARKSAHHPCAALIAPEPANPHDLHAVAVSIHGIKIGYLERDAAREFDAALRRFGYDDAACAAMIVGGWDRGEDNQGSFGVRLDAYMPFEIETPQDWFKEKRE
jgi:hypothetical protein